MRCSCISNVHYVDLYTIQIHYHYVHYFRSDNDTEFHNNLI